MSSTITRIELRFEQDVVETRQRTRLIAEMLGSDRQTQTRIATAVSEISRNALQYGLGGEAKFFIDGAASEQWFGIAVCDQGPGIAELDAILEGRYRSSTGLGLGLMGSRRLLPEYFTIESRLGGGTCVTLGKQLPRSAPKVNSVVLQAITTALASVHEESPLAEIRSQNHELLSALELVRQRDQELMAVNNELITTNAGIVALYTELENKSQRLERIEQILLTRNQELKGFAYTVSHDLRAPLRGIAGYSQELERKHKEGLNERGRFCLSQILSATHNLDNLIKDLMDYARLDAESPVLTTANLRQLIDTILKDRSLIIIEQQVVMTLNIPDLTLSTWVCGLVQVLTNLIDNALKYSRKAKPPHVIITAKAVATGLRICVSDNGIGFDMKYQEQIFGLFNRLERSEEFEGTGAGLAIVKKVLAKLGGSIQVAAQPGLGAVFTIELSTLNVEKINA